MFEAFEDKGKIYTQVINKLPIKVVVQTATQRIIGNMHVRVGERLKEELDAAVDFLAVTEAEVFDSTGNTLIYRTNFIAVNRQQIIWVIPEDDLEYAAGGK